MAANKPCDTAKENIRRLFEDADVVGIRDPAPLTFDCLVQSLTAEQQFANVLKILAQLTVGFTVERSNDTGPGF